MNKNKSSVLHREAGHKGEFYIESESDESKVATLSYSRAGDAKIIIDHTEVDESLRGTGTGEELVSSAVSWARENKLTVLPLCPFANAVIRKHPEYQDVLQNNTSS
ncbi:MAG: GNAT family N-acetyltransferase [Balneolaceae bacterium]